MNKTLDRVVWELTDGDHVATALLRAIVLRLLGRTGGVKLPDIAGDYIPKSHEYWSDALGPSVHAIKRAFRDLRDAELVVCRYPKAGFTNAALTAKTLKEIAKIPSFKKAAARCEPAPTLKPKPGCKTAPTLGAKSHLGPGCKTALTLQEEDQQEDKLEQATTTGKNLKTDSGEGNGKELYEGVWKIFRDKTGQKVSKKRREFCAALAAHYGDDATGLVARACDEWPSFRAYVLFCGLKKAFLVPDLGNLCWRLEALGEWRASHEVSPQLTAKKFQP